MTQNRRKFIKTVALSGTGTALFAQSRINPILFDQPSTGRYPIYLFSKPLDKYEDDFIFETVKEIGGIAGFDLTVRPGGKIEPQNVVTDLPKFMEKEKRYGLKTKMMVTSFTNAEDQFLDQVLKTASSLGIEHYRLGYVAYGKENNIWEFLQKLKTQFSKLIDVNKQYNIQAGYQNHAGGPRFGTPLWDMKEVFDDMPVKYMSSQFDVRHAMAEGASTYILAMKLIKDKIGSLAIKDFTWNNIDGKVKTTTEPLGEGIVDFNLYFKTIKELNLQAPITLHIEYPLITDEQIPLLKQQEIIISKIKKDVDFVYEYLNKYQLI